MRKILEMARMFYVAGNVTITDATMALLGPSTNKKKQFADEPVFEVVINGVARQIRVSRVIEMLRDEKLI